ncbi:glycosyltransferase [Priestia aryabhattai]|uniref:glycosyltransferase n=1 Tax=Priestia aryabhattai TaxID=412384 RepID=UPI001CD795AD|nr:glycosyltransferase [Priestia aryabhattai]MCA1048633.1 glycosyltransferase [Priestia aryabhattai]
MDVPLNQSKKKILVVNNNLATGGVQRSLVNLLNHIKEEYEVTLLLFSNSGNYVQDVPSEIKVIEAAPLLRLLGISQAQAKKLGYAAYSFRSTLALYTKIFNNHLPISLLISNQRKLSGFDVAISFLHNAEEKSFYGGCNEFVLQRVQAKLKIAFIHCDYSNYGGNTPKNQQIYKRFDKVAAVSEGCLQSFVKAIPELEGRTQCVYNFHNYSEYMTKANENPINYPRGHLNIVTVARLSSEKGILRGIEVIKRLIKEKYRIRWHIIGDGSQRNEIEKEILDNDLKECIVLYGNQDNPYRFIKNADLFFLPSFHEAAPMVFNESKYLGIPIVTTNTTSAVEMVKEGFEGTVCENNEEGMYKAIKQFLNNPKTIKEFKDYLTAQNYSNVTALEQFRKLIEVRDV